MTEQRIHRGRVRKTQPLTIGQAFGHWTVIGEEFRANGNMFSYLCRCSCGLEQVVPIYTLIHGKSTSCNPCGIQRGLPKRKTHGHGSRLYGESPEYLIWSSMKNRCTNPTQQGWKNYGGRGIRVCPEWMASFETFYAYVGPRPTPEHSIDRVNNDGNYEPGNVRWATKSEQMSNMTSNRIITHGGLSLTLANWARRLGIRRHTLANRLNRNWPLSRALTSRIYSRWDHD